MENFKVRTSVSTISRKIKNSKTTNISLKSYREIKRKGTHGPLV